MSLLDDLNAFGGKPVSHRGEAGSVSVAVKVEYNDS